MEELQLHRFCAGSAHVYKIYQEINLDYNDACVVGQK